MGNNIPGQLLHPVIEEGRSPLGLFRYQGHLVSKERCKRAETTQVTQKVKDPQMTAEGSGEVTGLESGGTHRLHPLYNLLHYNFI